KQDGGIAGDQRVGGLLDGTPRG
ncbi:MAG: hypothetical protein JWR22_1518, partial [Herminiimonas sp.]|nr:hypothetical protein [Herminiimonas sp.]